MSGGIEQRVWMHYKSLKYAAPLELVEVPCDPEQFCEMRDIYDCDGCIECGPHRHYIRKTTTPNWVWLRLARTHKMPVRQVKDIINKRRGKVEYESGTS
jgi:hypothetical protein